MYSAESTNEFRQSVLEELRSGRPHGGERLPAKRDLSEQWGIGRTVVRRVLAELRTRGLITQTVRSGTYVSSDASERL